MSVGITTAEQKPNYLRQLLEVEENLRVHSEVPPSYTPPVLSQDGEGLIWPHTISLVQGQTGTHKSRFAELLSSVIIAQGKPACDPLGLVLNAPDGMDSYMVCYIDTERNMIEQFPLALQLMRKHAGFDRHEHPENFRYTSLVKVPRTDRLSALKEFLDYNRSEYEGHLVVVIDQLADCISDFNDVRESMEWVDHFNMMANKADATFICVIHENPGAVSTKARGHLGTEASNKASTVLQLGFVKRGEGSDVVQIRCLERRSGIPNHSFHARYDAESGGLVRAGQGQIREALNSRQRGAYSDDIAASLSRYLSQPMTATELKKALAKDFSSNERTIQERLADLEMSRVIISDIQGRDSILESHKQGRTKRYILSTVEANGMVADTLDRGNWKAA